MGATARILAIALLVVGGLLGAAFAQEEPAEPDLSRIEQLRALDQEAAPGLAPAIVAPEFLGEEGSEALRQALTSYYRYRVDGYEHRGRVFAWQLLSSRIIFVLVIFLVLAGLYFSWMQFRAGLGGTGAEPRDTTFEASATGFKVSSPVLGVIILAISLAFFYLYLVHVYPIVEIL